MGSMTSSAVPPAMLGTVTAMLVQRAPQWENAALPNSEAVHSISYSYDIILALSVFL